MRPGVSGPVAPDVLENVQSWVLCFLKLIWLLWVARRHCSSVAAVQPGTASQWHIPEQIPAWDSRAVSYISEFRTVSAWTHVLELRAPLQGCIRFLLHCCLVFSQDWLLSSRVAVCSKETCFTSTVPGCLSPAMHAIVPVSYRTVWSIRRKRISLCSFSHRKVGSCESVDLKTVSAEGWGFWFPWVCCFGCSSERHILE